jgi:hypothetical protein
VDIVNNSYISILRVLVGASRVPRLPLRHLAPLRQTVQALGFEGNGGYPRFAAFCDKIGAIQLILNNNRLSPFLKCENPFGPVRSRACQAGADGDLNMNDLSTIPLTMSTLEIAGLTGKLHKNVLADARKMLADLEIQRAEFSARSYSKMTSSSEP